MRQRQFISIAAIAAIAAIVVAITGCGSSSSGSSSTAASAQMGGGSGGSTTAAASKSATTTVALGKTSLGKILVDSKGRTLYLFEADKPNMSNCSGACLSIWPAYMSKSKAMAGSGVDAAKIGTTADGQVTYSGHPLYYYAGDQKAGDTTGQGLDQFGAKWYVLSATGDKVDND